MNTIFFVLLLLNLPSCKNQVSKNTEIVTIDPQKELDYRWWDDKISDNIEYSVFDGKGTLPLSNTKSIVRVGDLVATLHYNRSGIFFHNLEGKFLFSLMPTGKGPLEFNEVNQIAKFDNKHILINDPGKSAIFKYDIVNQKIVEEYPTNTHIHNIYYANNKLIYTCYDFENGHLKYVDNFNFSNPHVLIKGTSVTNLIVSPNPFISLDENRVLINVGFLDTMMIFNTLNSSVEKKYVLGYDATNLMSFDKEIIKSSVFERKLKRFENALIPVGHLALLKDYLIIPILGHKNDLVVVLNLNSDESFFYNFKNNEGSKVDFVECLTFPITIDSNNDGYIYTVLNTISSTYREERPDWPFVKKYNQLVEAKVENPVIARFKLK